MPSPPPTAITADFHALAWERKRRTEKADQQGDDGIGDKKLDQCEPVCSTLWRRIRIAPIVEDPVRGPLPGPGGVGDELWLGGDPASPAVDVGC